MTRALMRARTADPPIRSVATAPSPRTTTAREALIAEIIGDLWRLLDRIDPLLVAMEEATDKLANAKADFDAGSSKFQEQVGVVTQRAKGAIVQHVERRTHEIAAQSNEAQTQAMRKAARLLFDNEVRPTLLGLTEALRQMVDRAQRPWDAWLTHSATALVSSILVWGASAFLHK